MDNWPGLILIAVALTGSVTSMTLIIRGYRSGRFTHSEGDES
jgi:hypothetical protein